MRGKIFYHGACFDGATSAALFADYYRKRNRGAQMQFQPMSHSSDDPFEHVQLDGDDNICVDFRYCADQRMNWWFDHHISAFQPRELSDHFEASASPQKVYDPTARSCAVLLANALQDRFEFTFEGEHWPELIAWADKIDGAQFSDAREAVELRAPALEIMTWLAHCEDAPAATRLIGLLGRHSLTEIASAPWIREPLAPVIASRERMIELIAERAQSEAGVVTYDSTDDLSEIGVAFHNKFIAYMLFPDARYTIAIAPSSTQVKISVGSNPWARPTREHNIARICERYGGGGHPVVGGISLPLSELDRARMIAKEIREQLTSPANSGDARDLG